MKELAKNSKNASREMMSLTEEMKTKIFDTLAKKLDENRELILQENRKDLEAAEKNNLNSAMFDRLMLTDERINQMINGVIQIKEQPSVVNRFFDEFQNESGLKIKKQRIPLGVVLMIFESRPNVVIDCAALAIKSSNSIILKGGKEAKYSNEVLGRLVKESLNLFINPNVVTVLASDDRNCINELLELNEYIDVVIPRGGHGLIEYVHSNAKMPVIAHFKGLCHMYIDKDADITKAIDLIENAKTQRTGVCNAIETLLIHEDVLSQVVPKMEARLHLKETELRVDENILKYCKFEHPIATSSDWDTEYLDNILSIKTVSSVNEAIDHIANHGSHHSECIVSENEMACDEFLRNIDASCVMINASTRFNDGGQLGLGAELGISTSKIHAYGPMGAEQMTTSRYVVVGSGHTRG